MDTKRKLLDIVAMSQTIAKSLLDEPLAIDLISSIVLAEADKRKWNMITDKEKLDDLGGMVISLMAVGISYDLYTKSVKKSPDGFHEQEENKNV